MIMINSYSWKLPPILSPKSRGTTDIFSSPRMIRMIMESSPNDLRLDKIRVDNDGRFIKEAVFWRFLECV